MIKKHLMALGIPATQSAAFAGSATSTALTATGTGQTDAFKIGGGFAAFGTVGSGAGAQLPIADPGDGVFVYNGGSNPLLVYGQSGESMTNGSANGSFSVAANKGCFFIKVGALQWGVNLSA